MAGVLSGDGPQAGRQPPSENAEVLVPMMRPPFIDTKVRYTTQHPLQARPGMDLTFTLRAFSIKGMMLLFKATCNKYICLRKVKRYIAVGTVR